MLLNTEAGYKYLKQNGYTEQQIGAGVRRTPHQTPDKQADKQKEVTALPQPEQSTEKPPVKASLSETPQLGLNGAAQVPVGSGQVPPGKSGVPPGKSASFSATQLQGGLSSSLTAEQLTDLGLLWIQMDVFQG